MFSLTDINECLQNDTCDENANCTNTDGSFMCTCYEGFSGDGQTCTGVCIHTYITLSEYTRNYKYIRTSEFYIQSDNTD